MSVPYASATSGAKAHMEIIKILQRFGCESVGFMDEFHRHEVLLAFVWRDRNVQLRASAQGWAKCYLDENPWTHRRRMNRHEWEAKALKQGLVAVNSILRDWVKGQVTAIETGILSFEDVFMPYMLLPNGTQVKDHLSKLIEAPPDATFQALLEIERVSDGS